eukprot:3425294-Pyramimonas_sp.AAC.1
MGFLDSPKPAQKDPKSAPRQRARASRRPQRVQDCQGEPQEGPEKVPSSQNPPARSQEAPDEASK